MWVHTILQVKVVMKSKIAGHHQVINVTISKEGGGVCVEINF